MSCLGLRENVDLHAPPRTLNHLQSHIHSTTRQGTFPYKRREKASCIDKSAKFIRSYTYRQKLQKLNYISVQAPAIDRRDR
jgi:hypothetical protein